MKDTVPNYKIQKYTERYKEVSLKQTQKDNHKLRLLLESQH